MDAGCDHPDVLDHCRGAGPYVRGCWVVDLVLGKGERGRVTRAFCPRGQTVAPAPTTPPWRSPVRTASTPLPEAERSTPSVLSASRPARGSRPGLAGPPSEPGA